MPLFIFLSSFCQRRDFGALNASVSPDKKWLPSMNTANTVSDQTFPQRLIAHFPYNYFALVMATGIVSIGCDTAGFHAIAKIMLYLNSVHYVVCLVLAVAKLVTLPGAVWEDLIHSDKGPGYLTMVAGTSVLGVQYNTLTTLSGVPLMLMFVSIALYLVVIFSMIAGIAMSKDKCSPAQGLDGLWLLCTVSGCSIVVLGMSLRGPAPQLQMLFLTALWSASIMLYFIIIPLIFFKWLFSSVNRKDFSPSWWINMGALAIASLAGVRVLDNNHHDLFLAVTPSIITITFFLWAAAMWWLLLLLTILVWRTVTRSLDLRYSPGNWSIVFPSGMFAVTTINVMRYLEVPLPGGFIQFMMAGILLLWLSFYLWMLSSFWRDARVSDANKSA